MSNKPTIGFCGLGLMGFGMATHLLKQGYQVKGYDVFEKTMSRWKDAGGIVSQSLEDSARDVPYYIVMVASMPQAQVALFGSEDGKGAGGIVRALPQNATILLCSTVPATYARSITEQLTGLSRTDISFIDCPVSGGAARAAQGTLSIMAGADPAALSKGRWLLDELSEKLYIVKSGVGGGSNLKMAHQVLAGIHILATSEALGLAARLGLNAEEVIKEVVDGRGDGWSWMFENRSPRALKEDYYPGASALTIILKDVGFGPQDDAGLVRLYHSTPIASVTARHTPTSPQTITELPKASANSSSSSALSQETPISPSLIIKYLRAIHVLSAAESLVFAHALGLDLQQFHDLVVDAAGGSTMFSKCFKSMKDRLLGSSSGQSSSGGSKLSELLNDINSIVKEARRVECALWLGTVVKGVFETAMYRGKVTGKNNDAIGVEELIGYWS
ncbi:putative 3-hydroxyisobutyrate dehydrogenase [Phaeomoniella chlamydospora]|uniref:Putative 3-hydroxyisobutyrate dehydrogenase n=1 Tax=Phaeomoniella chlamydospora TaxID=158046 RepID=A0A0G2EUA8_PHACM|nr:putative 3-hydroxyisobutyrate dehydrogenase [Phaeomoniella chlamydospora]